MRFLIYLDSRQSTGNRPSNCFFNLNQPVINGSQARLVSFVFANSLFNVTENNNTLVFSTTTVNLPAGYYTFSQFVGAINTQLLAAPAFVALMGGAPNAVVLGPNNTATWTIGTNILQSGSLYSNLVLQRAATATGNFATLLFLAQPMAIALNSPSIQGPSRFVNTHPLAVTSPFYVAHIESGFGEIESSSPSLQLQWVTPLSHANIQGFNVVLTDPQNERELTEMSHWSALLEITAS